MSETGYVPGQCNIGGGEAARRRAFGWAGLVVGLLLLGILVWSGVDRWWRLLVFIPVFMSASGFLQAHSTSVPDLAERECSTVASSVNVMTLRVKALEKKIGSEATRSTYTR